MADGTPESEFSIECFQNYSAPEVFIQGLAGMVNQTDVEAMIRAQKQMYANFLHKNILNIDLFEYYVVFHNFQVTEIRKD